MTSRLETGKSLTFFLKCTDLQDHHTVLLPKHPMLYEYIVPVLYCHSQIFFDRVRGSFVDAEIFGLCSIMNIFFGFLLFSSLHFIYLLTPSGSKYFRSLHPTSPFSMDDSVCRLKGRATDNIRKSI